MSKTSELARMIGAMLGTYLDVDEDSFLKGYGLFLWVRVSLDITKPLLRGKKIQLPSILDEC